MRKRPGMYIGSTGLGGPAPPRLGGRRQLGRRGDGRLLQPHRRHAPGRRRLPGRGRRSRHPGRPVPLRPAQGQERGRGRADRAARRRQVRRRQLQGLRRPPRRRRLASSTRCRSGWSSRSTSTARTTARSSPRAASPRASWSGSAPRRRGAGRPAPPSPSGRIPPSSLGGHRVPRPDRARAPADHGLPEQGPRDPVRRRAARQGAEGQLRLQGRHRRLREAPERLQGGAVRAGRHVRRRRGRPGGRGRPPVEHGLLRGHPRLRQRHLHHRGRHARGGLQDRAHHGRQQVRPVQATCSRRRRRTSWARTSGRASPPSSP